MGKGEGGKIDDDTLSMVVWLPDSMAGLVPRGKASWSEACLADRGWEGKKDASGGLGEGAPL